MNEIARKFLLITLLLLPSSPARAEVPTLDEILRAWTTRGELIPNFQAEWTAHEWQIAGSEGQSLPATDTSYDARVSLTVAGRQVRHLREGPEWAASRREFLPGIHLEQCDERSIYFFAHSPTSGVPPKAFIQPNPDNLIAKSILLLPVMLACRPLDPDLGWFDASKEWRVLDHEASLHDTPCVLLERRELPYSRDPANNEQIVTLWVAPSRDYHVLRYSTSNGPTTLSELTIEYELDDNWGWLPSQWDYVQFQRVAPHELWRESGCREVAFHMDDSITVAPLFYSLPEGTEIEDSVNRVSLRKGAEGAESPEKPASGAGYQVLALVAATLSSAVILVFFTRVFRRTP
jgi:hypothetical protein